MGNIKKVLAQVDFPEDPFFKSDLRIEVAEAIHVHWRDTRILMKTGQFVSFINNLGIAQNQWDGQLSADKDIILRQSKIPGDIIFNRQWKIEEQDNGCIHFHYGDIRIEMTAHAFQIMAGMFKKAKAKYMDDFLFDGEEEMIALDEINPYDHIHFPTKEGWMNIKDYSKEQLEKDYKMHIEGTEWMMERIFLGYPIQPLIVTKVEGEEYLYQRRDGYKRYMAFKALGYKVIPCYVVSENVARRQPQHKYWPFRSREIESK